MATATTYILLIFFITTPFCSSSELTDESFMSMLISQSGLDFLKQLLVNNAVASITPLQLPQIEKTVKIPFLGGIHVVLSNITIYHVDVPSSYIKPGDTGIAIVASGTSCNLSMNWHFSYGTWLVPLSIADSGHASVQVEGMEIGLTLGLKIQEGVIDISLLEGGCLVKDIIIKLDGGASWLYQGMLDAFQGQIASAVENAIAKALEQGVLKLETFLEGLPKEIPVDDTASINVTLVNDPLISNNSIGLEINGLFTRTEKGKVSTVFHKNSQSLVSCTNSPKMLGILLDEAVFNSASALYYNAEFMIWTVDTLPDQAILNTAWWRYLIPQLYKKYPNDDMNLNISLSAPPVVRISPHGISATVYADLIIDVLEGGNLVPVVCISLVIRGSGSVKLVQNNLAGSLQLDDFTTQLKWSQIGKLHMYLIQPVVWTLIETVCLPYANSRLGKGFPLPIIHGFTLQNAEIVFSDSAVTVCSDVTFTDSYNYSRSLGYPSRWIQKLL
ncbi:Lipid-binding serum glycoprotein family protein [Heracleum sosnowskyi]|uniref:Lipid-binding serum glycoprotein family protein n=1 Tax=Heracleum sosnowskyi TaxID=360622 RepID=A0AAD8INV6_9APIA|nr:Lipid-binding serum glycoprotein family protein [Heracleum sosnowskyi]